MSYDKPYVPYEISIEPTESWRERPYKLVFSTATPTGADQQAVYIDDQERAALMRAIIEHGKTTPPGKAEVILFKDSGKYYTTDYWTIPTDEQVLAAGGNRGDAALPYCMQYSPDFRRIGGGAVLVVSQEPWGFPQLFPGLSS